MDILQSIKQENNDWKYPLSRSLSLIVAFSMRNMLIDTSKDYFQQILRFSIEAAKYDDFVCTCVWKVNIQLIRNEGNGEFQLNVSKFSRKSTFTLIKFCILIWVITITFYCLAKGKYALQRAP